jgi:hypothetical protein
VETVLHDTEHDAAQVTPHEEAALHEAEDEGPSRSKLQAPPLQLRLLELPPVTLHELIVHSTLPLVPVVMPQVALWHCALHELPQIPSQTVLEQVSEQLLPDESQLVEPANVHSGPGHGPP